MVLIQREGIRQHDCLVKSATEAGGYMITGSVRCLLLLILLASLWGCVTAPPAAPPHGAPFFQPTVGNATQLTALASELDTLTEECAANGSCDDRMHFARALVSLFENREAARASFEQVMNLHPSSPLAASSALWLQLLKKDDVAISWEESQQRLLIDLTAQSVRGW